ncbi:hypothetical protein Dtox_3026 [Desulfofarcimen acetoxidans DSM 771]|jgi:hypothetical protein|uniref:Uncharacterized protein n=1 Tax=Desulfofarcimen acetoxidans (strain ATCC 49208 / DSM 771 / KCTC 5769 / VKM B-1644 / 5575) TaxID=485916 RepID=C8W3J2_DESAS|nr:hypothetical protein [Desulfofarcimen acetoxidans]ACV63778.1 hypothetical protein Dtox_3026 [Desulfofarcimen acetoxidans DSM 771]
MYNTVVPGDLSDSNFKLIDAHKKIISFFEMEFHLPREAVVVLGINRSKGGWKGLIQVTQVNTYLEMKGVPTIHDKNLYLITLDDELEVTSFWLKDHLDNEED